MDYLIYLAGAIIVVILFTNNPLITWVDSWACRKDSEDH